ncbi:MAG: hypothetical protein ACJ0AN_06365 [Alphaproteobacteria bacterium]|uniref:DUF1311 domain-containing protein n=1 Tax=PS1 clade bacterium TaxID=2175152 RepID=A0A368DPK3_9PROT|nr:hypothetical protein [Rhodobiaceae bacterium]OUT73700.1 MAG: hypothetical protein CBB85_06710 [Rhizobiales bacterium TMED25]RCL73762.1 MAG: hypothetical protein DBW71_03000 [PS1 clade bacterium]|tara:strand:- start:12658 stop:12948 length:291 start_codon:yes stop_codon:yes gene_type:complete
MIKINYIKGFIVFAMVLLLNLSPVNAEVISVEDEQVFLTEYCKTLVNEIEKSYQKQIEAIERKRTSDFNKMGRWIYGISDVFANLNCSYYINNYEY